MLERMTEVAGHRFWPDDLSIVSSPNVARHKLAGHRQVTDAHLLGLAIGHGGLLATFDTGIAEIVPDGIAVERVLHVIVA